MARSSTPEKDNKANWQRIYGEFLQLNPEDFGNGTISHLAKVLDVPRTTLGRKTKECNPNTGRDWFEERSYIRQQIDTTISNEVMASNLEKERYLQEQTERFFSITSKRALEYLEHPDFKVNATNLKIVLDAVEKSRVNYAKLIGAQGSKSGKGVTMKFNINVPIQYLTADGREWLKKQVENPTQNIVEADYEILEDEEDMKKRNQSLIEEL